VRADSLLRIQNEAAILMRMAKDCPAVGVVAGPNFAAALAEALRDAAGALLREIDFVGEAANLRDARAFYQFNRRIRVPAAIGIPVDRGIVEHRCLDRSRPHRAAKWLAEVLERLARICGGQ
jgi:ribosomal protein S12 methylthiotransferase accessory factor YcaO